MSIIYDKFKQASFILSEEQVNQFTIYKNLLQEWNKFMNLTAVDDDLGIIERHFIDSVVILKHFSISKEHKVIDVGTGAGFPGIPINIISQCSITLLDSLNKRIKFLKEVENLAKLQKLEIIHGRAEDFGQHSNYRNQYDFVVARAVAPLEVLIEYTVPFLKIGGSLIAYKARQTDEEIVRSSKAMAILGCELKEVKHLNDFEGVERTLIQIIKKKKTPSLYPRKAGLPSKEPLL